MTRIYAFVDAAVARLLGIFLSPVLRASRSVGLDNIVRNLLLENDIPRMTYLKKCGATSSNHAGLISISCLIYDLDVITSS